MEKPKKIPYYQIESSAIPFAGQKWKGYMGSEGCMPLNTQKTVSMDRLAPGEPAPPPKPKPTAEQRKAQQAEETRRKWLAQQAKKQPQPTDKPQEKPPAPDAEECENPPVFDMLDIPDTMEKMKWPVSAKIARKWFYGSKHIFDGKPDSVQPIDDSTVTLDWVLKFGSLKEKFHALLAKGIYSEDPIIEAKKTVSKKAKEIFSKGNSMDLSFNTTPFLGDLRQFHIDWHFQQAPITDTDTMSSRLTLNDLTSYWQILLSMWPLEMWWSPATSILNMTVKLEQKHIAWIRKFKSRMSMCISKTTILSLTRKAQRNPSILATGIRLEPL